MKGNEFVEVIKINSYEDLKDRLNDTKTFRRDYIFRGLGNCNYDLIPSALRQNEFGELTINDYIGEDDFFVKWDDGKGSDVLKKFFKDLKISYDYYNILKKNKESSIVTDKNGRVSDKSNKILCSVGSHDELQIKRELYLLLKFFNWVDETGLKIDVDSSIRRLIHNNINYAPKEWPNEDFFEIISLAQHYGLPTEALDWSYRYEVALYFAVKNILNDDKHDGRISRGDCSPFLSSERLVSVSRQARSSMLFTCKKRETIYCFSIISFFFSTKYLPL